MVRRVADAINIPFTVGGGLRTVEDLRAILLAGADKTSINSAAIRTPELITEGAKRFGCAVHRGGHRRQATSQTGGWEVYINGGRIPTGREAVAWAREAEARGAGEILLTSMDCDGTKDGYDIALTRAVADAVSIPVIASGGAGKLEHFYEALTAGGASAALAASLFHFQELSVARDQRLFGRARRAGAALNHELSNVWPRSRMCVGMNMAWSRLSCRMPPPARC